MKLRIKIPIVTGSFILVAMVLMATWAVYWIYRNTQQAIEDSRTQLIETTKTRMSDMVDFAYNVVKMDWQAANINNFRDSVTLRQRYISELNRSLESIKMIRFSKSCNIWIVEITDPNTIILNTSNPQQEGISANLDIFEANIVKQTNIKVFDAYIALCRDFAGGFIEFDYLKPDNQDLIKKISYVRVFEPTGWMIGTDLYTDTIDDLIRAKYEELNRKIRWTITLGGLLCLSFFAVSFVLLFGWASSFASSINSIEIVLSDIAKGRSVQKLKINRKDDIERIKQSVNMLIDGFSKYISFTRQIGKGNLYDVFTPLSNEDELGNSLLEMQQSLQNADKEEKKRDDENEKRNWVSDGIALFSQILRKYNDNYQMLTDRYISELVKHTRSNQGGVFLINDDNPEDIYLEMIASVAYNQKKFHTKRVEFGEGLIGACALEKQPILLNKIPEDYIEITSGIGAATPRNLLIEPILFEENVYGVIELASFDEFDATQIEFIRKTVENLAITILSVRNANQTNVLLNRMKLQSEQMNLQKQDLLKTIEDLHKNINDRADLNQQIDTIQNALNDYFLIYNFDAEGIISSVNNKVLEVFGVDESYYENRTYTDRFAEATMSRNEIETFWNELRKGNIKQRITYLKAPERGVWLSELYIPIRNIVCKPLKIIGVAYEITHTKELELQLKIDENKIK